MMRPNTSNTSTIGSKIGRNSAKAPNSVENVAAFLPAFNIHVESRPVTAAGIAGFKGSSTIAASNSSGRHLHRDGTYFTTLLRSKQDAIRLETKRLEAEIIRFQKENSYEEGDETKYKNVADGVKELTGILADYNIALDKYQDGINAESIEEDIKKLEAGNRKFEEEANQVFLKKTQYEIDCAKIEAQIADFYKNADEAFQRERPDKLALFHFHLNQSNVLSIMIQEEESSINQLHLMVNTAEHSNEQSAGLRADYSFWEKRVTGLQIEKEAADDELNILKMSSTEAIAFQTERLNNFERRLCSLHDSLAQYALTNAKSDLLKMRSELGFENTPACLDAVLFDHNTDEIMGKMKTEQERISASIVELLVRTSNNIAIAEQDLPTSGEYEEIKTISKLKSTQLQANSLTLERLQKQKSMRSRELEKIGKIEASIRDETSKLSSKIDSMVKRILSFEDLKGLHESYQKEKERLPSLLTNYQAECKRKEEDVRIISRNLESLRFNLDKNPTWVDLEKMEKRIREQGQNVYDLQESVSSMMVQTDYNIEKLKCAHIVDQLNEFHVNLAKFSY